MKKSIFLMVALLFLVGCEENNIENLANSTEGNMVETEGNMVETEGNMVEIEGDSVIIELLEDTATCSSNAVEIADGTITITDEGTYALSGNLADGMIIINAEKNDIVELILDNASINSNSSAAIYVLQSEQVFVTTKASTCNTISNSGTFEAIDENNIDGAIFSKDDITLNGLGTLIVTSPSGHGVVSKDSLTITGGTYDISCSEHAFEGKDEVCISDGTFTIVSGKDGIHAENTDDSSLGFVYITGGTFDISAEGDGISAGAYIQIESGIFDIITGGGSINGSNQVSDSWGDFMGGGPHGNPDGMMGGPIGNMESEEVSDESNDATSMKGLKAVSGIEINGGEFTINSADDALHSDTNLTVNSGLFDIASGDDAIHAEEMLTIVDGTINVSESYEGLEALDILISGGDISIVASDDGLNAAGGVDASGNGGRDEMGGPGMMSSSDGNITISGGDIYINASGDGIDANGYIEITGGYTVVCGPTMGDTATLDYDISATISGGTFIGTGASGMAQTFSESMQGVIAVGVGNREAKTNIILCDENGNEIICYSPELSYAVVILSSPDIISGEMYTITVGDDSAEFEAE